MKSKLTTITLALAALTVSSTVAAKTLVYCSEGSPENFSDRSLPRAALRWAIDHGAAETAARLAGSLWRYWYLRGSATEGRAWPADPLAPWAWALACTTWPSRKPSSRAIAGVTSGSRPSRNMEGGRAGCVAPSGPEIMDLRSGVADPAALVAAAVAVAVGRA